MAKRSSLSETSEVAAPSAVDPWVITQLGKCARQSWVADKLTDVYNKDVVDLKLASLESRILAKLDSLERTTDDTQRVFVEQRGKWSLAPKRHEVDDLKTAVTGWSSWFRRIIVGIIVFLIGTGGMAVWQYATLTISLEAAREENEKILQDHTVLRTMVEDQNKTLEFLRTIIQHQQKVDVRPPPVVEPHN